MRTADSISSGRSPAIPPPRPAQPLRPGHGKASLGEQGVAIVLARPQARLHGEHGAAGVVDVLVEGVGRQRRLELDELGRVLHEPDIRWKPLNWDFTVTGFSQRPSMLMSRLPQTSATGSIFS